MAVKALGRGREEQGQLGLRVDDAVAARRAQMRRRAGLRVVPPASDLPCNGAQGSPADFARRTRFVSAVAPVEAPSRPAPASSPGRPGESVLAPAPRAIPTFESDTTFEAAVAQAQRVATPVRAGERLRRARGEQVLADVVVAGEPGEHAQAVREEQVNAAPSRRGYRFTLRGQRVLVALGFAIAIAAGAIVGNLIGPPELPEETSTMVVQSGDSLWSIASALADPGEDLRPLMSEIRELNGLETAYIASGQQLVIPSN